MSLLDICKEMKIPIIAAPHERYANFKPTHQEILSASQRLTEKMKGNLILIGGQTVHPQILGYKGLRSPSDDLDGITNVLGIEALAKIKHPLNFIPDYNCLFTDFQNFPVFLVTEKVHDWHITYDFLNSIIPISGVRACAPEYTIMMKTRRAQEKGRFFGKDILDIAALMLAPSFREELRHLDYEKIKELVTSNTNISLACLIENVQKAYTQLKPGEQKKLSELLKNFQTTS